MARLPASLLILSLAPALWGQQPGSSTSRPPTHVKAALPDAGAISAGVYHNPSFRFSYKLPFGWVDRTSDMQIHDMQGGATPDDSADASRSRVLLAIFERPPQAAGDTVNSAVVIAAEPLFGGLRTAEDYFASLSALTVAKGFQTEEPRQVSLGAAQLVRGDFTKSRGTLNMRQTSLVIVEKGYAISFTFIGGSEDELNELIEKLNFAQRKPRE